MLLEPVSLLVAVVWLIVVVLVALVVFRVVV